MFKPAPPSIPNPPADATEREQQKKARRKLIKWYGEDIRPALQDRDKKTAYKNALEAWEKHVNKRTWVSHGLIDHRLERDYLEAAATYDIKGNRSKESATVGFVEQFIAAQFPEKRFIKKSQKGIVPRHGPEHQVDDFLAYRNVHLLETGLMMIEAKRHPEDKEDMRRSRMEALEVQVEGYCREWLEEYKEVPFMYALTCVSTLMRVWVMERPSRSRDMKNAKLEGLWDPDKRTWDEYKDTGLDCDANILKAAFQMVKDNPTGSDYALTTSSEAGAGDERARGRGRDGKETRDRTENGERRTERTENRARRTDAARRPPEPSRKESGTSSKQSSQQLNTPRDAVREPRDTSHEPGGSHEGGRSNTPSDKHQRRRSHTRHEPLPSSSPEVTSRKLPKPKSQINKVGDPGRPGSPAQNKDGKKPEEANKRKETATRKISRKRAGTPDSLSSRPPDSPDSHRSNSSSENQRPPPRKSSKTALRKSANPSKSRPDGADNTHQPGKPASGANA